MKELCSHVLDSNVLLPIMRDIMSARGVNSQYVFENSLITFLVSHQEVLFGAQACEEISEGKNTFEKNKHGLMGSV